MKYMVILSTRFLNNWKTYTLATVMAAIKIYFDYMHTKRERLLIEANHGIRITKWTK